MAEFFFLIYSTAKLILKFNKPKLPEPLLRDSWEHFMEQVWSAQKGVTANRSFLMGWFYDAPFESLREEDALSYLAWMKHGLPHERGLLSEDQVSKLKKFDLPLLIQNVNYGKPLPKRQSNEEALPLIRFNCEPLRYRHKPLLFYAITHGGNFVLNQSLKKSDFTYVPAADPKKDVGYWYRLPPVDDNNSSMEQPLVFVHGVGGLGCCYQLIDDLLENDSIKNKTPLILLDLPHVSLRMYDHIPEILPQVESISNIIDKVVSQRDGGKQGQTKATFVGHSFGTFLLSWMVQKIPERVGGCVFLGKLIKGFNVVISMFSSIPHEYIHTHTSL